MKTILTTSLTLAALITLGCSTVPESKSEREELLQKAQWTIERFKETDQTMAEAFFKTAKGYAVFPTVAKGGAGIGGAYGNGVLYENDKPVGWCDLSQGSIGLQLGGQAYSEIIFFETDQALATFKAGTMEFAAQASAVAASADAAATADYDNGVAVFTLAGKGLMYEASIGGQKFDYVPMNE